MARKHLLDNLAGARLTDVNTGKPVASAAPSSGIVAPPRGALGAVSRSIEALKAHAVTEVDPKLVDPAFIDDRLDRSDASVADLMESIRDHGQQVPVLLRAHPAVAGRYQVAYGHRRVRACLMLGRSVRAVIAPLSDEQLVIAQGQENTARRDLSYIERAQFAARLEAAGYSRPTIMAALSVDKTTLSRLVSAAVQVPPDIIAAIGPAPKVGRDRWAAFLQRLAEEDALDRVRAALARGGQGAESSDGRFERAFAAAAPPATPRKASQSWRAPSGVTVAKIKAESDALTLVLSEKAAPDFGAFVVEQLPELFAAYQRRKGG